MHKTVPAVLGVAALAAPAVNAWATTPSAKPRKTVTTKHVTGPTAQVDRWGELELVLIVRKTTTTTAAGKKVTRRITGVRVPVYPNHTDRSVFINTQAIPMLGQEVLQAQFNPNIQLISGATDTSYAFQQSLQAALLQARKA